MTFWDYLTTHPWQGYFILCGAFVALIMAAEFLAERRR